MRNFLFIAFAVLLTLSGCADVERKQQLSELDELSEQVSRIEEQLDINRCDTMDAFLSSVQSLDSSIRLNYNSDTLSLGFARKLDGFKFMLMDLQTMSNLQSELDRCLEPQQHRLGELRHDISNGSGNEVIYKDYIDYERNQVSVLQTLMDSLIASRTRSFEQYELLYNEIHDYALVLEELRASE